MKTELYCGDCLEIMKQIPDGSVDCIFTDVPYKQEFHIRGLCKTRPNYDKIGNYGSNRSVDYRDFFDICIKKLKYVNFFTFGNKDTKFEFQCLAKEKGYYFQELAFCKTSPAPFTNNQWLNDIEWGIHIFKDAPVYGNYHTKRSWFQCTNLHEKGVDHPTPKRVDICEKILQNITLPNNTVLDPYMGSGSLGLACKRQGRNFIGIELDDKYFQIAQDRINGELL